jgi:predicted lipoprotein with Yx(FWY)xxD motif
MVKMVYDPNTKKMVTLAEAKKAAGAEGDYERISLDGKLFRTLKEFATADGADFSGKTKETLKDAQGNVRKDKDGNTMYKKDKDGNEIVTVVPESSAKVSNVVRKYVEIAVNEWIAARNSTANIPTE